MHRPLRDEITAITRREEPSLHQPQRRLDIPILGPRALRPHDSLLGLEMADLVRDALQLFQCSDDVFLAGCEAVDGHDSVGRLVRGEQDLRNTLGGPG